jgi:RHS repeat-associated protein
MSGTSLLNETIAWNPDGTQSGNSITRNGSVSASDPRTYGYNQRGELLLQNFSPSSGQNGSATYQFDGGAAGGLGLRTGVTLGTAMSGVTAQSYGTFARLGSMTVSGSLTNNSVGTPVAQTYDAAGNVTTRTAGGSTDTLTWDAFGQLVRDVRTGTGAFTWSAVYDGLGRRLQTTQGTLTVQSSYDPEVEFLELVTTINGVRNWHVTGPDLDGRYGGLNGCGGVEAIYNQSTSSATYLLSDTYGHTEGILSGTTFVWNPTQCDGYGALPGTTKPSALIGGANVASQLGWRGHYIDPTGFYYMGARNYAPDSGTFLSPDPLGHSASMDLYSYCDGDPVNQYDADGRDEIILNNTDGAHGAGHEGLLIPDGKGNWVYTSKDGNSNGSLSPVGPADFTQTPYSSLAGFYTSPQAAQYNRSVLIRTTSAQDAASLSAVSKNGPTYYVGICNDCQTTVMSGLQAAGVNIPSRIFSPAPNYFTTKLIANGTGQDVSASTGSLTTLSLIPGQTLLNSTYVRSIINSTVVFNNSAAQSNANTSSTSPSGDPLSAQKAEWK